MGYVRLPASLGLSANLLTAHRALIVRKLKGLEDFLPYTSVHWHMGEKGMTTKLVVPFLDANFRRMAIC